MDGYSVSYLEMGSAMPPKLVNQVRMHIFTISVVTKNRHASVLDLSVLSTVREARE